MMAQHFLLLARDPDATTRHTAQLVHAQILVAKGTAKPEFGLTDAREANGVWPSSFPPPPCPTQPQTLGNFGERTVFQYQ